jgi:hypothetical protein
MKLTSLPAFTLATFLGLSSTAHAQEEPKPASKSLPKVKLSQPRSCADLKTAVANNLIEQLVNSYYSPRYYYSKVRSADKSYDEIAPSKSGGMPSNAPSAEPKAASAKTDSAGMGAGRSPEDGPSRYSKTNTQEKNIDELDFVKTDGKYVYLLQGNELSIFQSWPVQDTKKLGSYSLKQGVPYNLFLYKDRIALVSDAYGAADFSSKISDTTGGTRITILDISDRSKPKELRHLDVGGYVNDGRMVGDEIYFILETYLESSYTLEDAVWGNIPESINEAVGEINESKNPKEELRKLFRPYVEKQLEKFDIEATLPLMQQSVAGTAKDLQPLFACDDIYRPSNQSFDGSVMGVLHLDLGDDRSQPSATGVMGYGWVTYASTESLYLATDAGFWDYYVDDPYYYKPATDIHKFALSKDGVKYTASGRVTGYLLNQFSMSEHMGNLRVATTDWDNPDGVKNFLSIFSQSGNKLNKIGSIDNIAPGEEIQSVRMIGDKGYMVTFKQVDPLFTLDLSNPTKPKIAGELKIPGYSSYLHPMDKNHLLAFGMDGTEEGQITGMQVSIFDVSDFANPKQTHKYKITQDAWGSSSEAQWDHKAFTYMGGYLILPVASSTYKGYQYYDKQELVVLTANTKNGFAELGKINHDDLTPANGYNDLRRSIIIENTIFSISSVGLKVNDLKVPAETYASISFAAKPEPMAVKPTEFTYPGFDFMERK